MDPYKNPLNYDLWEDRWCVNTLLGVSCVRRAAADLSFRVCVCARDRHTIEITCVISFTCDLLIRGIGAVAAGKAPEFVGDAMNWIDFLAIFPFYVRLILPGFFDL